MRTAEQVMAELKQHANAEAVVGMARFGIRPAHMLGISIPTLRKMAKELGKNHTLALELWNSTLRTQAVEWAETISQMDSKTARWVAKDALRELRSKSPIIQ